jgi:hypothetical protein
LDVLLLLDFGHHLPLFVQRQFLDDWNFAHQLFSLLRAMILVFLLAKYSRELDTHSRSQLQVPLLKSHFQLVLLANR